MNRFEESYQHDFEKSVKLGEQNAECIKNMRQWCKHFNIEKTASGLYAEMTGLPIGSHKIQCPHAAASESMNLPWICSEFLVKNCDSCEHHISNGDTSWALNIIEKEHEASYAREKEIEQRKEKISKLRLELREQAREVSQQVQQESKRIVEFLEDLLSEDDIKQAKAVDYLKQSVSLAPDLFSESAIDLIFTLAVTDEYSAKILPICRELGKRRNDLNQQIKDVAIACIQLGRNVELAAAVLESLEDRIEYPLDNEIIERLLLSQNHLHPLGGWLGEKPDYSNTTAILVRSFDAENESIQSVIRLFLQHDNEHLRMQLCGAIGLIQIIKPKIVLNLLDELMESLELYQKNYLNETPSGCIVKLFKNAFRQSPQQVDLFLGKTIYQVRPTVQEELVRVYRDQFYDRSLDRSKRNKLSQRNDVSLAEEICIRRLINWVKDEKLDINTRSEAAHALEVACTYATGAILPEFDSLLGFYALVVEAENPPPKPPSIIIPGKLVDPILEQLNENNRKHNWRTLKLRLINCLEEACDERPHEVLDSIFGCYNNLQAGIGQEFKGALVKLLGKIGKEYELRPKVLPLIMHALMDYNSAFVRSQAIHAAIEMFTHSNMAPPTNLVETILVHLRDSKVIVHRAALYAVRRKPSWFNNQQVGEILNILSSHLHVYRNDPFQIKDICDAILCFSQRNKTVKLFSLRLIGEAFPTDQELVDSDIATNLIYYYQPDDKLAPIVGAFLALHLGRYERDRYNNYRYSDRPQILEWLLQLSVKTFQLIAEQLFESAKIVATRDIWESFHFANLFSYFEAFNYENEILNLVSHSLSNIPRQKDLKDNIDRLAENAAQNSILAREYCVIKNSQSSEAGDTSE